MKYMWCKVNIYLTLYTFVSLVISMSTYPLPYIFVHLTPSAVSIVINVCHNCITPLINHFNMRRDNVNVSHIHCIVQINSACNTHLSVFVVDWLFQSQLPIPPCPFPAEHFRPTELNIRSGVLEPKRFLVWRRTSLFIARAQFPVYLKQLQLTRQITRGAEVIWLNLATNDKTAVWRAVNNEYTRLIY